MIDPAGGLVLRWDRGAQTLRPATAGLFNPKRYTVEVLDHTPSKDYVLTHHYSGSWPSATLCYGLFDAGRLVGVCVFGVPTSKKVLTNPFPGLEPYVESIELSRLVLADEVPGNGESWFIARCFEAAALRGFRGVVSFADPQPRVVGGRILFPGHVGTIYQASNARLCGRGTPRSLVLLPTGAVLNARSMQKVRSQDRGHDHVERQLVQLGARPLRSGEAPARWLADALDLVGASRLRHAGNWRYCFPIGTPAQRRRVHLALPTSPYPKTPDPAQEAA